MPAGSKTEGCTQESQRADEELLLTFRNGDDHASEELDQRYRADLVAQIQAQLSAFPGGAEAAAEIAADALCEARRTAEPGVPDAHESVRDWFFRFADDSVDAYLMNAYYGGDDQAFKVLDDRWRHKLAAIAYRNLPRMPGRCEQAADIAAKSLANVAKTRHQPSSR